jgi:hypothetical protein
MILKRYERRRKLAVLQMREIVKRRKGRQFPFRALRLLTRYSIMKGDMMAKGCALRRGPGPERRRLRPSFIQYPHSPNIKAFSTMVLSRECI